MSWTTDPSIAEAALGPDQFAITHAPAANNAATITRAAVDGGQHVITAVSATVAAGATAPTATTVTLNLRNGASGAGTVLMSWTLGIEAKAGTTTPLALPGLKIPCSNNTAATLEFAAAGGANTLESVALVGYTRTTP